MKSYSWAPGQDQGLNFDRVNDSSVLDIHMGFDLRLKFDVWNHNLSSRHWQGVKLGKQVKSLPSPKSILDALIWKLVWSCHVYAKQAWSALEISIPKLCIWLHRSIHCFTPTPKCVLHLLLKCSKHHFFCKVHFTTMAILYENKWHRSHESIVFSWSLIHSFSYMCCFLSRKWEYDKL